MKSHSELIQYQICQAAIQLFKDKGYSEVTIAEIARDADVGEQELFTYFGNKQDILLFFYQSINADWQISISDISEKKLAERFELAVIKKLDLIRPHADILSNMMGLILNNSQIGIGSPRTSHIRMMGHLTMQEIVDHSTDHKLLLKKVPNLVSLLYLIHWGVMFLYVQSNNYEKTLQSVRMISSMLKKAGSTSFLLSVFPFFKDLSTWAEGLLELNPTNHKELSEEILKILFNHRKLSESSQECEKGTCKTCFGLHRDKIDHFIQNEKPIQFILPAFPAKSPNRTKVLTQMPDLGEEIALQTLENLCCEIESIYSKGATIIICSDGRIFSELVGVTDDDVTVYVENIKKMIHRLQLKHVRIVNLEDLIQLNSFDEARGYVLENFAEDLEDLTNRLKNNTELKNLFNGIHRFISDDRISLEKDKSRRQVKEESKIIALRVIQHSNAWTRFLTYIFPESIRLSIHPYPAHSAKIGIQLTKAVDNWITPWHGTVVLNKEGYFLMKKDEVEKLNARLVSKNGQPYYYTTIVDE